MKEIEPQHTCLNCSALLRDEDIFCPHCGQKKLGPHDFTFRHLVFDSIGDYFHFDGKFLKTLKSLLFHPGAMTLDYLAGKRVRYIQPFKLFLFISVVYFILIASKSYHSEVPQPKFAGDTSKQETTLSKKNYITLLHADSISIPDARKIVNRIGADAFLDSIAPGNGWLEHQLAKRILNTAILGSEKIEERLIHNSSKVVFILIPVMAFLLKLLYVRKKKLYFDHLIFALHIHAVIFLILIFYELGKYVITDYLFSILFFVIMLYIFLALKHVYEQKWGRTFLKLFLLSFGYLVIAVPVFLIVLFLVSFLF